MFIERFQKNLINGRLVIPTCLLLVVLLRLHSGMEWLNPVHLSVLLFQLLIALLLLPIDHVHSIMRSRTILPPVIYLMIVGTSPQFFTDITSVVVSFCFLLVFTCSFASYQQKKSQGLSLNVGILLSACSLLWAPAILFLPFFWLVFFWYQSLNLRSFIASLLGIAVVALFLFSYALYRDDLQIALRLLPSIRDVFPFDYKVWSLTEIIRAVYTILLVLFSFVYFVQRTYNENIKSRTILYSLYCFILAGTILMLVSGTDKTVFFSLLSLPSSMVIAHYFCLSKNKFTAYTLLISILFYLAFYFVCFYEILDSPAWIDSISIF